MGCRLARLVSSPRAFSDLVAEQPECQAPPGQAQEDPLRNPLNSKGIWARLAKGTSRMGRRLRGRWGAVAPLARPERGRNQQKRNAGRLRGRAAPEDWLLPRSEREGEAERRA